LWSPGLTQYSLVSGYSCFEERTTSEAFPEMVQLGFKYTKMRGTNRQYIDRLRLSEVRKIGHCYSLTNRTAMEEVGGGDLSYNVVSIYTVYQQVTG
jgi:hypothetical protein